jgi:uncharacterized membrane protein
MAGVDNSNQRHAFVFNRRTLVPRITTIMLAASAAVYIALRVWSIWTPRLWGDELFNYSLSQGSWITLFKRTGLDMAHPPLFYLLLKLWIYLADSSMFRLRILTVAISIAAIVPFVVLGRELLLRRREIVLALTLMALNNYLILYSYYLRPYSLLFLLTLCSHIAFVRFLRRREADKSKTLFLLVIINILFVYTHYFAWLAVLAQYLWIAFMDRRHLLRFTLVTAVVGVCFLPWVGVIVYVSTRVSYTFWDQIGWYWRPGSQSLVLLLRCFNGGFASTALTLAGSAVCLLLLLTALKYPLREKHLNKQADERDLKALPLLAWLSAFPLVSSLIVSYAFTWKWEPRYVIIAAGPYLLLLAASAFRLRASWARATAVVFLLAWASVAGFSDNLAEVLHGPNAPSYWLAQDLSRAETRTAGPIGVYGLSPYAAQGLSLAVSLTGERRFQIMTWPVNAPLLDNYFWIALTEHDPIAISRVSELKADPMYVLGEPIYSGIAPQRHIVIPVRRK